jgi:uncharacterized protein YsxB (DUF464 family)
MIKIKITKEKDQIKTIQIHGHSGYDEYGRDIVCASVSTMTITTINAIIRYDESSISYNQDEGLVNLVVLKHSSVVDLLLENLISLLKELESQYTKYVKIYE